MNRRSWITLGCIAGLVAVLGLARRGATPDPAGEPVPAQAAALPAILDFGRGTCVPCRQMMPVLDELREAYAGVVEVRYLDLAEQHNAERAREFGVKLIPTQVFVAADGAEVFRHEGFIPREAIEQKLRELGWTSSR